MNLQRLISLVLSWNSGASSGIGEGTALHFASLGCWLSLTGRDQAALDKVAGLCRSKGLPEDKVLVVPGDLSKEENVENVLKKTLEHFQKLDILVNSAGIVQSGTTEFTPLAVYDHVMNINLRSVFHMMQVAIPPLKKTKGAIVNVSSICGLRAFSGIVAYNISKAGLDQLTRTAALELGCEGIRVNAVNPGVIMTQMQKRSGMSEEDVAKFYEKGKTAHALGRVGAADEVARTIAFLASEDASFITGETLAVDGGRIIACPQ